MRMRPVVSLVTAFLVGLAATAWTTRVPSYGQEQGHGGLSTAQAIRAYREWMAKLHDEKFLGDVEAEWTEIPRVFPEERTWYERTQVSLKGTVLMRFDVDSGQVVRFWNFAASSQWENQRSAVDRVQPDWSAETALHRAEDVLRLFLGPNTPLPRRFRPGWPKFYEIGDQRGLWSFKWMQELNGYPFEVGGWSVLLHEQFGLISYSGGDVYDACPTEVRIGRPEALRRARELVATAFPKLTWDTTSEGITGLRAATLLYHWGFANGSLIIIHPNEGFQEFGGIGSTLATSPRAARLSYIIEFEPKEGHRGVGGDPGVITVYLDAGDGRIIGGSWANELDSYYQR